MATENSEYTSATDDYDGDTTETIPSADSNYLSNQSDGIASLASKHTTTTQFTEKTEEDIKHDNIPPEYAHKSRTNIDKDRDDDNTEQKGDASSTNSGSTRHHRKRSGLFCIFALIVLWCWKYDKFKKKHA